MRILDKFEQDDDKPFVLYIAPQAPHEPWEPEEQYATADVGPWVQHPDLFETDRSDKPSWVRGSDWTAQESADIRTNQLRTLKSVDDMVAAVMGRLDELGEGSNTMSVLTSDNGYQWGEHGLTSKYHPYNHSIGVPFMVRWPGHVPAGRVDRRLIGNVDITPSLLAAARVTPQLKYPLDGIPFLTADGLTDETKPGTRYTWSTSRISTALFRTGPPSGPKGSSTSSTTKTARSCSGSTTTSLPTPTSWSTC